jgi:SNF2 family DNA or RNA helicase
MNQTRFEDYLENAGLEAKHYQKEGVSWILERENEVWHGVRGGIIADEMGLGKTIMMIGTMLANFKERTLVVLPRALLEQWANEIERTTGYKPMVYHGAMKKVTPMDVLKSASVVLTTYGEIQVSCDEFSVKPPSFIQCIEWNRIVFDEAHHLRNMRTNKFKGGHMLKSSIRWMITGTPIQNRTTDFFALCHVLGFEDTFYANHTKDIMKHSMMRRTKESVGIHISHLVSKTIEVPWNSDTERRLAEDIHASIVEGGLCEDVGFGRGIQQHHGQGAMLMAMLRARQMCILPKMLTKKYNEYCDEGFISEDDEDGRAGLEESSKMDKVVATLLERKNNGNKKIVFCHYHQEMDELSHRLLRQDLTVRIIDGRLKNKERHVAMLKPFPDVMVLQINTCCEGLNLQDFNEIYFVSPHWNPAVEDQAVARCHRIGQKKDVFVFSFKMQGVDEEDITLTQDKYCSNVQENKRNLYVYH